MNNHPEKAIDTFTKVIEYNESKGKSLLAYAYTYQGDNLFKMGNYTAAFGFYAKATALSPELYSSKYYLTEYMQKTASISQSDALAHYKLALFCKEKDLLKQQEEELRTAARLRNTLVDVHFELAEYYYQKGNYENAIKEYEIELKYNPVETADNSKWENYNNLLAYNRKADEQSSQNYYYSGSYNSPPSNTSGGSLTPTQGSYATARDGQSSRSYYNSGSYSSPPSYTSGGSSIPDQGRYGTAREQQSNQNYYYSGSRPSYSAGNSLIPNPRSYNAEGTEQNVNYSPYNIATRKYSSNGSYKSNQDIYRIGNSSSVSQPYNYNQFSNNEISNFQNNSRGQQGGLWQKDRTSYNYGSPSRVPTLPISYQFPNKGVSNTYEWQDKKEQMDEVQYQRNINSYLKKNEQNAGQNNTNISLPSRVPTLPILYQFPNKGVSNTYEWQDKKEQMDKIQYQRDLNNYLKKTEQLNKYNSWP
jgi:tetratricopeptide (TPR) repeat protein